MLVAQLWQAISRYPLDRRPRAIPAKLLLDARRDARAATTRATAVPEVACPALLARHLTPGDEWTDRVDDRVDLGLAAIDANITRADLALITLTRLAGWRITDLARGSNAARLRQRRHRAEARLSRELASHTPPATQPLGRAGGRSSRTAPSAPGSCSFAWSRMPAKVSV